MRKVTYTSLAILLVLILLGFLFVSTNTKAKIINSERFYAEVPVRDSVAAGAPVDPSAASAGIGAFGASDPMGNETYNPVVSGPSAAGPAAAGLPVAGNCFPRDRLAADDLLPKDAANSRWSQMNPSGQGDISDKQFLTAGYHVGVDTVGSSMKIPNLDFRSAPPNPRVAVSPWNISTAEYTDVNRRPLEIGGDY
jgi:hypothetical protein